MDVLVDVLVELTSQAASGVVKVILAGLGVIVVLVGALIAQIRKNKRK